MTLGARIRALRTKTGESLQEVADAIGASKAHVWELETGRSKNPSLDFLTRVAKHFKVSVAHLIGEGAEAEAERVLQFGRDFENLSDEDWEYLRGMAERLKGPS